MLRGTWLSPLQLTLTLLLSFDWASHLTLATDDALSWALESDNVKAARTAVKQQLLWRRSFPHVSVSGAPLDNLLGPLLDYRFLLPAQQLKAGVAYAGARRRLRRFVRDLLSGQRALKIGIVGGSISWGQGASAIGTTDWFSLLARWMIETFPAARITARNGAVPATPSSYMVMCLEQSVDPDVDLVLVEYGMNDGYDVVITQNSAAKPMERLIRRLLALPGKPAVIMMQVPMYGMAMEKGSSQHRGFYFTNEDVDAALAHYYDVPYLSLRTALYRLAAVDRVPGWRWQDVFADFHPGDTGFHVMADLVVHLLQSTAVELATTDPWVTDDAVAPSRPLPPPMYPGNEPPSGTMCVVGGGFPHLITANTGFTFRNEATNTTTTTTNATSLPAPATATSTSNERSSSNSSSSSANRTAAATKRPRVKPKWGFVANWSDPATQPQPRLVMRLDTRRPSALLEQGARVPLYVLHLRSYKNMGRAEMSCVLGCSCSPLVVDAHITEHVSQTYLARLNVTQSAQCEVAVKVLRETSSGQRKFKVSGVVVSETGGDTTVLERMSDPRGYWEVGRFHTGDLPMATYGRESGGAEGDVSGGGGSGGGSASASGSSASGKDAVAAIAAVAAG